MTRSLQEASDKLREVEDYPDDVNQPVIVAADSAVENPITWMILSANDPEFDVQSVFDEVDKRISRFSNVWRGSARSIFYGGKAA
ncbi:MAG: hypothetical protein HC898_05715, partial [Phycisphaerales bacterium]|nr:hypothetical protein [Phycisphaerales bacterium]